MEIQKVRLKKCTDGGLHNIVASLLKIKRKPFLGIECVLVFVVKDKLDRTAQGQSNKITSKINQYYLPICHPGADTYFKVGWAANSIKACEARGKFLPQ